MTRAHGNRTNILLALVISTSVGCARSDAERLESGAAEFRYEAGEVYQALLTESCVANPALRRAVVLANEDAAVRAFEARMSRTPLRFHLDVARSDAVHGLALEGGCWEDSDPRFAARHVQMARDSVRRGLARIEELAPALGESLPLVTESAAERVRFRYEVRRLVEGAFVQCPMSATIDNDQLMAPARAELVRLRGRLEGTAYALHYDIAKADAAYHLSISVVDCVDPDPRSPAELGRNALNHIRGRIALLEARL